MAWPWGESDADVVVAVPSIAGKANAAHFVRTRLGFDTEACVAAGDSANDAPMLRSQIPFVVVANATDGLRRIATAAPEVEQRLHYHATASHATGVTEGLAHFRQRLDAVNSF